MIALIGIILLIGIVKKNAIMMIDFALEAERKEGKSPDDAIYEACLLRFRPIMMTTMAALLGALPLAIGTGVGSELRRPLGIAIVGGLIVSQILTLYTTPVIYLAFDRLARRFGRRVESPRRIRRHSTPGAAYEHVGNLHPAAGCHDAADHRRHARRASWRSGSFPSPRFPQVEFPTINVSAVFAGRQPGNHGDFGRGSARTSVRAHCGRDRDDVYRARSAPPASLAI